LPLSISTELMSGNIFFAWALTDTLKWNKVSRRHPSWVQAADCGSGCSASRGLWKWLRTGMWEADLHPELLHPFSVVSVKGAHSTCGQGHGQALFGRISVGEKPAFSHSGPCRGCKQGYIYKGEVLIIVREERALQVLRACSWGNSVELWEVRSRGQTGTL
jgi:hypothetical protein